MIIDELDDSLEKRREILIDISNSQICQTQQSLSHEKMEMNVDKKRGKEKRRREEEGRGEGEREEKSKEWREWRRR